MINLAAYSQTELLQIWGKALQGIGIKSAAWGSESAASILPRCEQEIYRRKAMVASFGFLPESILKRNSH